MATRKVLRAAARAAPRRQEYSSSTRRALIESATSLFTERGYAGTSLDEIVKAADVTKGALYHHYGGKLDLFEDVVERSQRQANKTIERAVKRERDPWERAQLGVRAFLELCQEPVYRRLVLQEAPVALGAERWQSLERQSTYGIVATIVHDLFPQDGDDVLRETFAQIFYGAIRSAGVLIADSDDPEVSSVNVQLVITAVLAGLRQIGGLRPDADDLEAAAGTDGG